MIDNYLDEVAKAVVNASERLATNLNGNLRVTRK